MSIRYNYNQQLSPPAPFVHVTIARPDRADLLLTDVAAQIDSAADMSVIPAAVVEKLGLVQLDRTTVAGFGGHVSLVPTYLVSLAVKQLEPATIRVLADRDEPYVLLGRDILNQYSMLLDGPNLIVEIGADRQK